MNIEFEKLSSRYKAASGKCGGKKDEQNELLSQIRDNLKKRNGNDNVYKIDEINSIDISDALFDALLEINNDMIKKEEAEKREKISEEVREKQVSLNKYGPNNPYPQGY